MSASYGRPNFFISIDGEEVKISTACHLGITYSYRPKRRNIL